jgi:hypothetical protein
MFAMNSLWGTAFVCASALDLLLTWLLINAGAAYELNPIAACVLSECGWTGLAWFKAFSVGVVLAAGAFIARNRPVTTRRLLHFACAASLVVVGYSLYALSVTMPSDSVPGHRHRAHRPAAHACARTCSPPSTVLFRHCSQGRGEAVWHGAGTASA